MAVQGVSTPKILMKKSEIEAIQMECNAVLNSRRFMNLEKTDADFCGVNQLAKDIGISEKQL